MLQLCDLTVARETRILLDRVNLSLAAGDKAVIVGPSGSGKSSLLAVIAGMLPPGGGQVFCGGREVTAATLPLIRRELAVIEQEPVLAAETVEGALLLPFGFRANAALPRPERSTLCRVLAEFELPEALLSQPCSGLSGGEKQRVAVARVKLLGRRVILADEATSALDDRSCEAVLRFLLSPEVTTLAVSHDQRMIARFSQVFDVADSTLRLRERGASWSI